MINITLKDGLKKQYKSPLTGKDIASSISPNLAKEAIVIKVDEKLMDLSQIIEDDCKVEIITKKSPEALEIIRHDAAHIMAEAVQNLFPNTQVTIGPPIKDGFYYDFDRKESFLQEDFVKIENKMNEIIKKNELFTREVWSKEKTIKYFKNKKENYKVELIEDLKDKEVTIYKQGDWLDLCKGPHSPSTGFVGDAFKLLKLSGAYWRGDSKNTMLQRIYASAWF